MSVFWIVPGIVILVLAASYVCFRMAFLAKKQPLPGPDDYPIPEGEVYQPFAERMTQWMREVRDMPHRDFCIRAEDGLVLWGSFYEYAPGATIEIMFHGYRGSAERDLCGGVQRAFALGRSVLLVDQRTACRSQGKVITFGVREHRDCLRWAEFCVKYFGEDVKLILTGISMGAATVLLAAGEPLPPQVVGVLADCGYTSAREMIEKTLRDMRLPVKAVYPLVKLGARLFGGFNLEDAVPEAAVRRIRVPTIFFHGEADGFVPCEMSRRNFEACPAPKALMTIPNADHGLSYPVDPAGYLHAVADFFTAQGVPTTVVQKDRDLMSF